MVNRKSSKKQVDTTFVKELHPKDHDFKYYGPEPLFLDQPENRTFTLAKSFNWYSRFFGRKDAKDLIVQYLDLTGKEKTAKVIRKVDEKDLNPSLCWLARMTLRGLKLTDEENTRLQNEIARLITTIENPEVKESKTGKASVEKIEPVARPNVQEIMKEKARECAGELEGLFDEYIQSGAKANPSLKPIDIISKSNILAQHIYILTEVWKKKKEEFEEVLEGKNPQLVEGYSRFTKTQIKNILKTIEQFLGDFNSYVSIKKANKTPRKRKAVPVEKQVSKLKYLKEFKDSTTKLNLIGLHPVKLHGASEAWVYDTAKRKLHHYIADEYSKTFTVKGNTLLGFDKVSSEVKTLRKPQEQIKEIMSSKPAARKYFKEIKAVSTSPNGRFNESMLILKAF